MTKGNGLGGFFRIKVHKKSFFFSILPAGSDLDPVTSLGRVQRRKDQLKTEYHPTTTRQPTDKQLRTSI